MLVFALAILGGGVQAQSSVQPMLGSTTSVQVTRIEPHVTLGATVVPYKEVTLSAQMPGRVEYIAGEEGDRFDKAAVLVALGDDELLAGRRAATAELANADSAMRAANVQYSRELYAPQSRSSPGAWDCRHCSIRCFPSLWGR